MAVRVGTQIGPRGKFGFRNIPKRTVIMEAKSKKITMEPLSKRLVMG